MQTTSILIAIGRDLMGAPVGLTLYPQRESDWKIYYAHGGKDSKSNPRQLQWVASCLHPGERLRMEPKPNAKTVFHRPWFDIINPDTSVRTGPVTTDAIGQAALDGAIPPWEYSIILSVNGVDKLIRDPIIIIEPDP